jgi:hypothetical protein
VPALLSLRRNKEPPFCDDDLTELSEVLIGNGSEAMSV